MHSLTLIRFAFEQRMPDAFERAERARDDLVAKSVAHLARAELAIAAAESGIDYRFLKNGAMSFPLQEAERDLEMATAWAFAASDVTDLIESYAGKRMNADEGATSETLYRVSLGKGDPIMRLRVLEHITDDHVRTAREIEAVNRFIVQGLGLKAQRLPIKTDGDDHARLRSPAEHMEHMALLHAVVYGPWTRKCKGAGLALAVAVEGHALDAACRLHAMGWKKGLETLRGALDAYAALRREKVRDLPGEAAAQAERRITARA